jgi:hypothetical protein
MFKEREALFAPLGAGPLENCEVPWQTPSRKSIFKQSLR